MTEDEWNHYQNICKSYNQGSSLFAGLFQTDTEGLITFLIPPSSEFSFEVVLFLQNVMLHQYIRKMQSEHNRAMDDINNLIKEAKLLFKKEKA